MTLVVVARAVATYVIMHVAPAEPPDPQPLRIVTTPCFHFMVRPNTDGDEVIVTAQVSVCSPM